MISFPLSLPTHTGAAKLRLTHRSVVSVSTSPFDGSQQAQAYDGQWFEFEMNLPPMEPPDALDWIVFLLKLNGMEGTFLAADPSYIRRGTCLSAEADGDRSARSKTLSLKSMVVGSTLLPGDYIQLGTGATSRLHRILNLVTADSSGEAVLDIWPKTRDAVVDADAVVTINPVGVFRLVSNEMPVEVGEARIHSAVTIGAREHI